MARALKRHIVSQGHQAIFINREQCDFDQEPDKITATIQKLIDSNLVIIAAAYTNVECAETNQETAYRVNSIAPGIIGKICAQKGIPLIYISTDYVFDGTSSVPYAPQDITNPINEYGVSKLAGENSVFESRCNAVVIRTSWVFDGISKNFFTTMLSLADKKSQINVVSDQYGRPTYAGHLAQAVLVMAENILGTNGVDSGIFHVTGTGKVTTWAEFAKTILAKINECQEIQEIGARVLPVTTSEYPSKVSRPAYSVLDVSKFEDKFNYNLPNWQDGLKAAKQEYLESKKSGVV